MAKVDESTLDGNSGTKPEKPDTKPEKPSTDKEIIPIITIPPCSSGTPLQQQLDHYKNTVIVLTNYLNEHRKELTRNQIDDMKKMILDAKNTAASIEKQILKKSEEEEKKTYGSVPNAPEVYQVLLPKFKNKKQFLEWEKQGLTSNEQSHIDTMDKTQLPVAIEYEKLPGGGGYQFRRFLYEDLSKKNKNIGTVQYPSSRKTFQELRERIVNSFKIPTMKDPTGTPIQVIEGDAESAEKIRKQAMELHNAIHIPKDKRGEGYYEKPYALDRQVHRIMNLRPELDYNDGDNSLWEFFDRYYSIYPDYELSGLCHYIFMTRPDLNLMRKKEDKSYGLTWQAQKWPTVKAIWDQQPWIIRNLSSHLTRQHQFVPFITSRIEMMQLPDYQIKNYSVNQPYSAYLLPYASNGITSTTGGTFDIRLREMNDLSLHKYFQIWLEYISKLTVNLLSTKRTYLFQNRADYMVSFFDLICAPDAKTILYWNKYTGCFPVINPNSSLSFNKGDRSDNELTVQFQYFHSEPINPLSLVEFNMIAGLNDSKKIEEAKKKEVFYVTPSGHYFQNVPLLEVGTGYAFALKPFIKKNKDSKMFELGWMRRETNELGYY